MGTFCPKHKIPWVYDKGRNEVVWEKKKVQIVQIVWHI